MKKEILIQKLDEIENTKKLETKTKGIYYFLNEYMLKINNRNNLVVFCEGEVIASCPLGNLQLHRAKNYIKIVLPYTCLKIPLSGKGKVTNIKPNKISKKISDGYHSFEELYEHRTYLFSVICRSYLDKSWIAFKHEDGTMFNEMFIAGFSTPTGDYTYHCEKKYLPFFEGVKELEFAPKYDGHTPDDYLRLDSLFKESFVLGVKDA